MKEAYYIMKMWQTGNIGSHNITKAEFNPKEGFKTYELAEQFLINFNFLEIPEITWRFNTFCIMKIYSHK